MKGRVVDLAEITGFTCQVGVGLWEIAMDLATRSPECEADLLEILDEFERTAQKLIKKWVS